SLSRQGGVHLEVGHGLLSGNPLKLAKDRPADSTPLENRAHIYGKQLAPGGNDLSETCNRAVALSNKNDLAPLHLPVEISTLLRKIRVENRSPPSIKNLLRIFCTGDLVDCSSVDSQDRRTVSLSRSSD